MEPHGEVKSRGTFRGFSNIKSNLRVTVPFSVGLPPREGAQTLRTLTAQGIIDIGQEGIGSKDNNHITQGFQAMQRKLGGFENAWTAADEFAPLTVLGVLKIEGSLRPQSLRKALQVLQQRHPLLRTRIRKHKGAYRFYVGDTPPVPLHIIDRKGNAHWQHLVEDALNRSFDKHHGPLATCTYLIGAQDSLQNSACGEIILAFHHSIVDGVSGVHLYHDLLSLATAFEQGIASEEMPPLELQPAVEKLLPKAYRGWRGWYPRMRFMKNQITEEIRYQWKGRNSRRLPIHTSARCRTLHRVIEADLTTALVKRCRSQLVTLNNALGTAMLLALFETFYENQPTPMRHITFSNLRPYLKPIPTNDTLGCYISMTRLMLLVERNPDYWFLVRQMNDKAQTAAKRGDKYAAAALIKGMMQVTLRLKAFRMGATALSYMGVADLDAAYGSVIPVGLHTFVSNFTLGPEYAGVARLFKGQLWLDLLYLDNDMDTATAQAIADRMLRILQRAANVTVKTRSKDVAGD